MSFSERMFYFQSARIAEDEDRARWARNAERSWQLEIKDAEDSRRRRAEYNERQRTLGLEKRHTLALAFLRRVPLALVAVTRDEVKKAVGTDLLPYEPTDDAWRLARQRRADQDAHDKVVRFLIEWRDVFDDGIAYPDIETIAKQLADIDGVSGWYSYLSLPHVMTAERIYVRLTNFRRPADNGASPL